MHINHQSLYIALMRVIHFLVVFSLLVPTGAISLKPAQAALENPEFLAADIEALPSEDQVDPEYYPFGEEIYLPPPEPDPELIAWEDMIPPAPFVTEEELALIPLNSEPEPFQDGDGDYPTVAEVPLKAEPSFVTPGGVVNLFWEDPEFRPGLMGRDLLIRFPNAFTPQAPFDGEVDLETRTLRTPVTSEQGRLRFMVDSTTLGPYHLMAEIFQGEDLVGMNVLVLESLDPLNVGRGGGQAAGLDGKVRVDFPPQALGGLRGEGIKVHIRTPREESLPPDSFTGYPFEIVAYDDFDGEEVRQFAEKFTIQVAYDREFYAGVESELTLYYYDEESHEWRAIPSWVDEEAGLLFGLSDHLTVWDFNPRDWQAARLPGLKDFQVSPFTGAGTYSYEFEFPPGPAGLQPSLTISYNSQSVDSATAMTQSSWVGMGWSLDLPHIQRNMQGTGGIWDDTFVLEFGAAGGMLIPILESDGDGISTTHDYRLSNDNFYRIRHVEPDLFHSEAGWNPKYPYTTYQINKSYWIIEDKAGNQYHFSTPSHFPVFSSGGCQNLPQMHVWRWSLTKVINIHGKELNYSYEHETATKYSPSCPIDEARSIVATYPKSIIYPHSRYEILFERGGRTDYDNSWLTDYSQTVLFQRSRLTKIIVRAWTGVNFQTIREYRFTYGTRIFSNSWWTADGYTETLASIREFNKNGDGLPATTFSYDGHHMTGGNNGYGGSVSFTYDTNPWYETTGTAANVIQVSPLTYHNAEVISEVSTTALKGIRLGQVYKIQVELRATSEADFGIRYDKGNSSLIAWSNNVAGTLIGGNDYRFVTYVRLPKEASQAKFVFRCRSNCYNMKFDVYAVTTRYRVNSQTLTDSVTGAYHTYNYRYDEPATNDPDHSDYVKYNSVNYLSTNPFSEFRGHAMMEVTGPVGSDGQRNVTRTYYHQDDKLRGSPHTTLVGTQNFTDPFNTKTSNWGYTPSNNNTNFPILTLNGDPALKIYNPNPDWNVALSRGAGTLSDNQAMITQFRIEGSAVQAALFADSGMWGTSAYRRWGLQIYHDKTMVASYYIGTQGYSYPLGMTAKENTWYTMLLIVDNENLQIRVWERDKPSAVARKELIPGGSDIPPGMTWRFSTNLIKGSVWLDDYSEGNLHTLSETIYDPHSAATVSKRSLYNYAYYYDLQILWKRILNSKHLVFSGDGSFTGQLTTYAYKSTDQGGKQHGNRTMSVQSFWNGSAFQDYRAVYTAYFPRVTNPLPFGGGKHLNGLPGYANSYSCPVGNLNGACVTNLRALINTWPYGANHILTSQINLFDDQTTYNAQPINGKLTAVRTFTHYVDPANYAEPRYADVTFAYDGWGNRVRTTSYSGAGTWSALASSGARNTITTYDPHFGTYPTQVQNPLGATTAMEYDYVMGVPTKVIDPSGAETAAEYDIFGRIWKIIRPGDTSGSPSAVISYQDTTPFRTDTVLKVDVNLQYQVRKFYNGFGNLIQTQTIGASLADPDCTGTCDVIVNTWYDAYGQAIKQSVPYGVSTGYNGYRTPLSKPFSETKYDILGRPISVKAPNGTFTARYTYDDLETRILDARGHQTRNLNDALGRIIQVIPPTGPSVSYQYDQADQLMQVSRGGSVTSLDYDKAGRKLSMNDPNMGIWSYGYDYAGNLTAQVDARACTTTLSYDLANRLTGKIYSGSGCGAISPVSFTRTTLTGGGPG